MENSFFESYLTDFLPRFTKQFHFLPQILSLSGNIPHSSPPRAIIISGIQLYSSHKLDTVMEIIGYWSSWGIVLGISAKNISCTFMKTL